MRRVFKLSAATLALWACGVVGLLACASLREACLEVSADLEGFGLRFHCEVPREVAGGNEG